MRFVTGQSLLVEAGKDWPFYYWIQILNDNESNPDCRMETATRGWILKERQSIIINHYCI